MSEKAIYLDHAATSLPKPESVIIAVTEGLRHAGNGSRGAYEAANWSGERLFRARLAFSRAFAVGDPSRVIFTHNASESLNLSLFGAIPPGARVLAEVSAHNSILRPLHALVKQRGIQVDFVLPRKDGRFFIEDFAAALKPDTRYFVFSHASNLSGNLNDLAAFGNFAHEHGLFFMVDAAQTAGLVPIDLQAMHIDCLCITGHKSLLGPQGTGLLCLGPGVELEPLKYGGTGSHSHSADMPEDYPDHLEAGTLNTPGICGLAAGLAEIQSQGMENLFTRGLTLAKMFYEGLREIPGIEFYGDYAETSARVPIVTLNLPRMDAARAADLLSTEWQIACRSGIHCAPRMHDFFGSSDRGSLRFSFAASNTEVEIEKAIQAVKILASLEE